MRRVVLSHVCGLSLVLLLAGCEALELLLPLLYDGNAPSEPAERVEPVGIERASTFLAIERGRVLSATTQGLRIIDVRSARVEGLYPLASDVLQLYRMDDDHVVLVATFVRGYGGERDDVPVRRAPDWQSEWLLNIDIRDRAHPTLVNQIALEDLPRHSLMRRAPQGNTLFVLPTVRNGERDQSRVDRYELRNGVLENTAQLTLDAVAQAVSATPDKLLAATQNQYETVSTVTALDITRPELSVAFTAKLPGAVNNRTQLSLDHDQLRVLLEEPVTRTASVVTFQLNAPDLPAPSGHCKLGASLLYELDASLFSEPVSEFFVSNARREGDELEQLFFDAAGNCPERVSFGPQSRSYALRASAPERLLAVGSNAVTLYDTARDAKEPVLARTALSSAYSGGSSSRPLQLTKLASPTTAGDGTPEPLLVSLPQYGPELNGRFQLLTLSDHTLTTRAAIDQRGTAEGIALFGRTLVTVSSTQLSTFDARDLNAAVELGQVELAENYRHVFGFGEHVVRIREHPSVLAPEERGRRVQDDLQVLRRSDGQDVVASLPVESVGTWLQVGPVLVNVQLSVAEYGDEYTRKARVAIQAYDLSDPGAHL